jgi:hypothetical protein
LSFRLAVGFAAVGLAGCGDDSTGPILCTEEFRLGISIQVRDGATGAGAAVGAEGTITEQDYVEVLQIFGDDTMAGAGERAGTYDIRITKPGFNEWTASQVTVTADECHVRTVGLEANLVAIP